MEKDFFDIYALRESYSIEEILSYKDGFLKGFVNIEDSLCFYERIEDIEPSFETTDLKDYLIFLKSHKTINCLISLYFICPENKEEMGMIFFNLDGSILLGKRFSKEETNQGYDIFTKCFGVDYVFYIWSESIPKRTINEIKKDIISTKGGLAS